MSLCAAGMPRLGLCSCRTLSCLLSSVGALTWKAAARMLWPSSFLQRLIEQFGGNCATKLPKGKSRCGLINYSWGDPKGRAGSRAG